jgi:hypothetical protein
VQFAEIFPETPVPHRSAVCRLIEKFCGTGSVLDAKRRGRPSKSLCKLAQEEDIGLVTAYKVI